MVECGWQVASGCRNVATTLNSGVLRFRDDGAQRFHSAAMECLADIERALADLPHDPAGTRLFGVLALRPILARDGPVGRIAASLIGPNSRPVRVIMFDKPPNANWPLDWHQDRTIAVGHRIDVAGFGPWSIKGGVHHVSPTIDLLARMLTLRVHLDQVPFNNAPLLIACGSHRCGVVPTPNIAAVVAEREITACLAERGDVWAYGTLILHASKPASPPTRRRVLHIDYSPDDLPDELEWLGV